MKVKKRTIWFVAWLLVFALCFGTIITYAFAAEINEEVFDTQQKKMAAMDEFPDNETEISANQAEEPSGQLNPENQQVSLMSGDMVHLVTDITALQDAIDGAASGDTIELSADLNNAALPAVLTISNKSLTFRAESGTVTLYAASGARHMTVSGGEVTLSFENVILDGGYNSGTTTAYTGGMETSAVTLELVNAQIQSCYAYQGGGIYVSGAGCSMIIYGSDTKIGNNTAESLGGGISAVADTIIYMYGGSVIGNSVRPPIKAETESGAGGGILTYGTLILKDGLISENVLECYTALPYSSKSNPSGLHGAGVCAQYMEMYGGEISHNRLTGSAWSNQGGGGVSIGESMYMEAGEISYNKVEAAGNGQYASGGGIFGGNITIVGGAIHHNSIGTAPKGSRGGGIVIDRGSELHFSGGEVYENTGSWGGGIFLNAYSPHNGNLHSVITGDAKIYQNYACYGSGITVYNNATFGPMETEISGNVKITGNVASPAYGLPANTIAYGGGVFYYADLAESPYAEGHLINATISGSVEISGNTATYGGGILTRGYADPGNSTPTDVYCALSITEDVKVCGNQAETAGGILVWNSDLRLTGNVLVSENVASGNGGGGGIRHSAGTYDTIRLTGQVRIIGNKAENGNGGGIFAGNRSRLFVDAEVVFADNTASKGYAWDLDTNALPGDGSASGTHMSNILTGSFTTPFTNAYNNYDVGYLEGTPVYVVTFYDEDGLTVLASFAVDTEDGTTVISSCPTGLGSVEKPEDPTKAAVGGYTYIFDQWNPHGEYSVDDIGGPITQNMAFTASYIETESLGDGPIIGETTYIVAYDANGGAGAHSVTGLYPNDKHTVFSVGDTAISHGGHFFVGWNTSSGGGGTAYKPGDIITVTGNITLFAQWSAKDSSLDRENHYAYMIGYPDGTVQPESNITRAEVATIFFRLLTVEARAALWSDANQFSDVSADSWYNIAISTLANGGILTGRPDGTFAPDEQITRAEFAAIAVRFNTAAPMSGAGRTFSDISGHWAENAILLADGLGYVEGYGDGTFRPAAPVTRAEVATLLNRVLHRHVESEEDLLDGMIIWQDNRPGIWYYYAMQEATNSHFYNRKADGINEVWTSLR